MPTQTELEPPRGACGHEVTEQLESNGGAVLGKRCAQCGVLWYARKCRGCTSVMLMREEQKRRIYCTTSCRAKAARQRAKERQNPLTSNAR